MDDGKASTGEAIPAELALLRNTVACELHWQLGMRGEKILLIDVAEVAYAVAVRLRQAYRIECVPLPEGDRCDDESLGLDGATFYGSALAAGDLRTPPDRYPIFDHDWPER